MNNRLIVRLCAGASLVALSLPVDAAVVRGRVVDATTRAALPGATVRAGDVTATADKTGGFVIDAPDGVAISADYVGYATGTATPGDTTEIALANAASGADTIVVTGNRLAERRALQTKKSADNFVEALYANDVGKLPDQNVAEAVRRLPGLSVANDQGEGRYVIIRGIAPNLVNVTLNGQTLPAPEPDSRQVKLDDIPSALISAVVVTKSLTADQDANAIGGAVDIRTISAFDRNKPLFVDARGAIGRYKLNGEYPAEGDVQVGGLFGADRQFGAVVSVNYSRRPIQSENLQGTTNYVLRNGFSVPDQFGLRDYNLIRTRLGVVGNFDWQPSDTVKLFARLTYSRFTDSETRDQNRIDNQSGFTNQTATSGTFVGRGSVLVRIREEKDNTRSAQLGGSAGIGAGTLEASGTYTRAVKIDPIRSEYNFRTGGSTLTVNYDLSSSPYIFAPNAAAADPTRYSLNSVNYDTRQAKETLWQGRVDYTLPIGLGDGSSIKVGAKYLDRRKTNNRDFQVFGLASGRTFALSSASYTGDTGFYDGRYTFGPRIGYDTAQAYLGQNPGTLAQSSGNVTSSINNSLAVDYDVSEKITAGYAMATLKFGALTLIPGIRVEHTRDRNKAKIVNAASKVTDPFNSFGGTSYTDVFPGLNARYDVTRDLVLRAAVTTATGRPNYPDLAPYVSIDTTASPVAVSLGNPALKPFQAVNFDAAIEYYLPGQGVLSIGAFYKTIDNPIYTQSTAVTNGTFAGQTFALANVLQPLNADKQHVEGVEANAQVQFSFLPSPFDGFGASANFTVISGRARGVLGRVDKIPLFLQSKRVGTAQLFYEKYGFTARVAYSYRSAYLDALGSNAATDQYTDDNGQLDVHVGYQINDSLTVFADGINLNDAPWRRYIGTTSQLIERERYDYSIRAGVQLHF